MIMYMYMENVLSELAQRKRSTKHVQPHKKKTKLKKKHNDLENSHNGFENLIATMA